MSYQRYSEKRNQAKRAIHIVRITVDERCGRKIMENFM